MSVDSATVTARIRRVEVKGLSSIATRAALPLEEAGTHVQARRGLRGLGRLWWMVYLLPSLATFALMVGWPTISLFVVSLLHFNFTLTASNWVGLHNYAQLFAQPLYWRSIGKTALYALMVVPATVVLSILLALVLARSVNRVTGWVQAGVFLPHITPVIATSLIWVWIFNPQFGLANSLLHWLGLPGPNWLESTAWALPAVSVTTIWHSLGLYVLIMIAALARIPKGVLEAAAVDGASAWTRLRRVILPLMSPSIFAVTVLSTIANMQSFGYIFLMTGGTHGGAGGPAYSTTTDAVLLYYTAFKYQFFGLAAAMSVVLFALIMGWTLVQKVVSSRWVFYR